MGVERRRSMFFFEMSVYPREGKKKQHMQPYARKCDRDMTKVKDSVFFPEQNDYCFLKDTYPMNCFRAVFKSSMAFCC